MSAKTILLIDDEEEIVELYREIIRDYFDEGRVIIEHELDGNAGLRRMKEEKFDLIITDIRMPGLNGIDAWLEAHKSGLNKDAKVIMISGYAEKTVENLVDESFSNVTVLDKPFQEQVLMRHVKMALKMVS